MSSFFVTENTHVPIVFSGDYNDWYRNVMVGYVGDIMVHNINNNFSLKKNITNNSCVLYFKITNHNFSTL